MLRNKRLIDHTRLPLAAASDILLQHTLDHAFNGGEITTDVELKIGGEIAVTLPPASQTYPADSEIFPDHVHAKD
jgi:hypothetical protein